MIATEQMLRRALNQRIRHGKTRLRKRLRRNRWSSVLKHPALIAMVGKMIRERAAQPPLFPLMFENLVVREVKRDT